MDMVGHQTVANERQAVPLNALAQKIEVNQTIRITIKDEPSRVPALRHAPRYPKGHEPGRLGTAWTKEGRGRTSTIGNSQGETEISLDLAE
jgi:hypothetical protein